jgi:dihydrofolate synthase/folylpolyglutamate synthase
MTLSLRGEHQVDNAVVAVRLLEAAMERRVQIGVNAVEIGISTAVWPARLELLSLEDGHQLLLDAAHNAEGAAALAAYLKRWHPQPLPLVVGIMRDKDVDQILTTLLPFASRVTATAAPTRRALPAEELAARITAVASKVSPTTRVTCEPDPIRAVEDALNDAELVCVAGSIVLVGTVRERFAHRAILH